MTDDLKERLRGFDPHIHELEVVDEAADRIEALELALTKSRAETAAAYERAAGVITNRKSEMNDVSEKLCGVEKQIFGHVVGLLDVVATTIRALATPDKIAALDAVRAEARAQGMREAADIAEKGVKVLGLRMREAKDKKEKRDWQSMLFCAVDIKQAILAAIKGAKA